MDIHYRIKRMEESGFMFKPDFDYDSTNVDMVNYQFSHQIKANQESNELALNMVVEITPADSNVVIAREIVFCVFEIEPFDKVIQIKEGGYSTNTPLLIDTFINVAIGALRGLLVKNLKGTPLAGTVIPLIPMSVIRQNSMQEMQ